MHALRGGAELGKGGYGKVCTLDDLRPGTYTMTYIELPSSDQTTDNPRDVNEMVHGEVLSKDVLVRRYGTKVVVKLKVDNKYGGGGGGLRKRPALRKTRFGGGDATRLSTWGDRGEAEGNMWFLKSIVARVLTISNVKPFSVYTASKIMPLFVNAKQRRVYVSITDHDTGETHPIYKFMHGDVHTLGKKYEMIGMDVFQMAVAVMRSLIELQDRVGVHHCDVKPENVLFSILNVPLKTSIDHDNISHMLQKGVKELFDVKYSFVLTDFGNAVIRPERIGKIYGTRGYTCPIFSQGNREQHLKDHMGLGVTLPDGNHVDKQTHRTIWKSYSWLMEDASKLYDRLPVKQCYAKNDLYALGVTLLRFDYHEENHPLAIFGWLLVSGARDAIWSLHEAYKVLKTVRKSKLDRDVEYITYEQAERRGMDPHYYGP